MRWVNRTSHIWVSRTDIYLVVQHMQHHYTDVIITTIASQITSFTLVYLIVYSGADKKKTSKLCVTSHCAGKSPGPVNSPHKWPVTRKMFPFDDYIMQLWTTHHITEPCDFRLSLHYPTPLSVSLQKPMQLLSTQILQILSQCLQNFTFTMCFRTVAYVFLLHRVDCILRPFHSVWTLVF